MELPSDENHLGVSLIPIKDQINQNLFVVKDIQISDLPIEALRVRIEKVDGLRQLAYEIDNENITEVLAGLRCRCVLQLEQMLMLKRATLNNNGYGIQVKM